LPAVAVEVEHSHQMRRTALQVELAVLVVEVKVEMLDLHQVPLTSILQEMLIPEAVAEVLEQITALIRKVLTLLLLIRVVQVS
jgi:hypothetical protein